ACAAVERWAKSGPKMSGPQTAPVTAPNSTNDMPRARRSGGNISAAAALDRRTTAPAAPSTARPTQTRTAELHRQPPAMAPANAPPITGMRPVRSESRPAGPTAAAPEARRMAGPRPRMPFTPVTATSVTELSAAASWKAAEFMTRPPASRKAFRRTSGVIGRIYAGGLRRTRARRRATDDARAVRREEMQRCARRRRRRGRASAPRGTDAPRRSPVRRRRSGVRRHDVPEQDVVGDAELVEHPVDDRRGGLGGAGARQLPFRRERDAADARPSIPSRLADEHDRRIRPRAEIRRQPLATQLGRGVLVVRRADPRACERVDELHPGEPTPVGRVQTVPAERSLLLRPL